MSCKSSAESLFLPLFSLIRSINFNEIITAISFISKKKLLNENEVNGKWNEIYFKITDFLLKKI